MGFCGILEFMRRPPKDLETLLFTGRYEAVLEAASEHRDVPVQIGALSFLGRLEEARALFELRSKNLTADQLVMARFFLTLGLVRTSAYAEARAHIARNLRELGPRSSVRARFYAHQGIAFYRFFCGRWESGLRSATVAFEAAYEDDFLYGKVLASDLRGHLLVQVSNVDEGIRHLQDAVRLARLAGNKAVADAAEISILSYVAQYGLRPSTIVTELEGKLRSLKATDTYSRAALLLELARQLMLHGRLEEVRAYLDQAAHLAYMYRNRRQEATLNLRLAHLCFLRGEAYQGLSFTQAAQRCLDLQVDRGLELACLGLQHKIVSHIGLQERADELALELSVKSRQHGNMIHLRMLRRSLSANLIPQQTGTGDRLGALRDSADVEEIIKTGQLQLLYDVKGWKRQERAIVFDVIPQVHVVLDKGRVHLVTEVTTLGRKILASLLRGRGSKAELISEVWGYDYDPLRHDALVYNAVNGLRRALGTSDFWLETTERGYRLPSDVRLILENAPAPVRIVPTQNSDAVGLNSRQLSFLKKLKAGQFAHVKQYQKIFQVSEITACRDLAMLCHKGYLIKVGRARATRYALPGDVL